MGDLAIDWSSMVVKDGEDVSWKNPYDWSFLKTEARERRRGRDRERRGGGGSGSAGGGTGEDDIGGGGSALSSSASSSRPNPRGKRKVANKKKESEPESGKRGAAKVVTQNIADVANQVGEEALSGMAVPSANAEPPAGGKDDSAAAFGSPGIVETISALSSSAGVDNGDCSAGSVGVVGNKLLGENNVVPSSTPAGTAVERVAQAESGTNPAAIDNSEKQKEDGGSSGGGGGVRVGVPSRDIKQGRGSEDGTSKEIERDGFISASDGCRSGLVGAVEKGKDGTFPFCDDVKPSMETVTAVGDPVGKADKEATVRKATNSLGGASGAAKNYLLVGSKDQSVVGPDSSSSLATTSGSSDGVAKAVAAGQVDVADKDATASTKEEHKATSPNLKSAAEAVEAAVVEKASVADGRVDGSATPAAVTVANGVVTSLASKEADLAGGVGEEKGYDSGVAGASEEKIRAQGEGVTASPKEGRIEDAGAKEERGGDDNSAKEKIEEAKGSLVVKGPAASPTTEGAAAAVAASPGALKGEAKREGVSQVRFLGCVTVGQIGM